MNESFAKMVAASVVAYFVVCALVGADPQIRAWVTRQWSQP